MPGEYVSGGVAAENGGANFIGGNLKYILRFRRTFAHVMELKDRILRTSQQLFMRNGIRSVSMDDIAAELAVSKKTLYKWYENKDQLVYAMMEQHLDTSRDDCAQVQQQASSAIDELFRMMSWMKQQVAEVHPSIFYDMQKFHPTSWQLWVAHKQHYILAQILDNLRRGMAEGLYRADLDADVLARLRLAQIEVVFDPTVFPPQQFDVQRIQHVIMEHFMLGVATLKGHQLINERRGIVE